MVGFVRTPVVFSNARAVRENRSDTIGPAGALFVQGTREGIPNGTEPSKLLPRSRRSTLLFASVAEISVNCAEIDEALIEEDPAIKLVT